MRASRAPPNAHTQDDLAGSGETLTEAAEDHRVRVARERRDRMRKRLLTAVVESFARPRRSSPPTVDEIVEAVGVVRGTFYKYFPSIDEAIEAAGQELFSDMDSSSAQLLEESGDGLSRLAAGIELFLIRIIIDPFWSAFIARADHLGRETPLRRAVAGDLSRAHAEGRLPIANMSAASTLVVGALTHAIRDLSQGVEDQRAYMEALTVMILCGLGVQPDEARAVMRDRAIFIRGLAPDRITWWRDPWR
jgi:AcrR family transcriptional regulator